MTNTLHAKPTDVSMPLAGATDEQLENALQQAEIPSLLVALALATGDQDYLPASLRPPHTRKNWIPLAQGGLDEEQLMQARQLALTGLRQLRDAGPRADEPTQLELDHAMQFLVSQDIAEYRDLLLHEVSVGEDRGAPAWSKDAIDPERAFSVLIIGAGVSGLALLHRLNQAGVEATIIERNSEVGGTWWDNTYPGCRLDTHNFPYSYSFAQKKDWPNHFSKQPDIRDYLISVSHEFRLRDQITFGTTVEQLKFNEATALWEVTTRDRDGNQSVQQANVVVNAVGQLSAPKIPQLPGREKFQGIQVHSARWDPALDLEGKRVAVVGTGASAFQIAPAIADSVASMTIFQRSAPWGMPTPHYHDPIDYGQRYLFEEVPGYASWFRFYQFWIATEGRMPTVTVDPAWPAAESVSETNAKFRDALVAHIKSQYTNRPDLIDKVVPDYPAGAKRMLRDNGVWAETLQRENVNLVQGGVQGITPTGVVDAEGAVHEVDVIIYATGFRADEHMFGVEVIGRDGLDLQKYWAGDSKAYATTAVPNFPNFFMMSGPNTAVVANGSGVFMSECLAEYVVECVHTLLATESATMEPTEDALDRFVRRMDEGNSLRAWGLPNAESWYKNKHGRTSQTWPFEMLDFWKMTRGPVEADYDFR